MDGAPSSTSFGRPHTGAALDGAASAIRHAIFRSGRVIRIFAVMTVVVSFPMQAKARIPDRALDRAETAVGVLGSEPNSPCATEQGTGGIRVPSEIADVAIVEPGVAASDPKITIYRTDTSENFEIGLHLALTSDTAEGEVALRLRTPRDYYAVRVDGRASKVSFSRVIAGRSFAIASAERSLGAHAWHSLRVRAQGNRFTVTLDDDWLFTAYDATLQQPGPLAVWTGTDRGVEFDRIAVTPLAPE
jgi:hypothetical protein